jgi:hypothetical protein
LPPQEDAEPLSLRDEAEQSAGESAEHSPTSDEAGSGAEYLNLRSTPAAADAWLYVGTTPNVTISRLKTGDAVELRIEQEGQLPLYRSVDADAFDAEGRASLHLILPASMPAATMPEARPLAPGPSQATAGQLPKASAQAPQKKWRPKRKLPAPASANANAASPANAKTAAPANVKTAAPANAKTAAPANAKTAAPAKEAATPKKLPPPIPDWAK